MIVFLLARQISCIAAYVKHKALRSSIVKKMFYSYDVGTGCCVGFNGVFSKLKSTLIC